MPVDMRIRELLEEILESNRTPEDVCAGEPDLLGNQEVAPRFVPLWVREVGSDLKRHVAKIGSGGVQELSGAAHVQLGLHPDCLAGAGVRDLLSRRIELARVGGEPRGSGDGRLNDRSGRS